MKKPPFLLLPLTALMCLLAGSVLGQGIVRLKDINTQAAGKDAQNNDFVAVVNSTYFIATDDHLSGSELWKSDGTLAGTVLVRDIVPGAAGSNPRLLTAVGTGSSARLFFVANANGSNESLWISDGTRVGTRQVTDVNNLGLKNPSKLFAFGNTLYFEGDATDTARELWRADLNGNAVLVKDIANGSSSNISSFTVFKNSLYFLADDGGGIKIWKTDGTAGGTAAVTNINTLPEFLTPFETGSFGPRLLFSGLDPLEPGTGRDLWYSDGVSETALLYDVEVNGSSDPQSLLATGGWLYFTAEQVGQTRRLYRTDGVSDNQGPITSSGGDYSESGNLVPITVGASQLILFTARDDNAGMELWRSNGTSGGNTIRAMDIFPGATDSNPSNFMILGPHTVLFTATTTGNVLALYRCEGSTGSLVISKVKDLPGIDPDPAIIRTPGVASINGVLKAHFFLNHDEFWVSDGTFNGTVRIKQFRAGDTTPYTAGSHPADFAMHGSQAYFSADDGLSGRQVWSTDGTSDGTVRVSNIFPASGFNPSGFASSGSHVYFAARNAEEDYELWRTDGTTPILIRDINPGDFGSNPTNLLWSTVHNRLFFAADDGTNGVELWRSDGTADGTVMVKDMLAFGSSEPNNLLIFKDQLFFVGDTLQGRRILVNNGVSNDVKVMSIPSVTTPVNVKSLTVMKNLANIELLYFVGSGSEGEELWVTDGVSDANGSFSKDTTKILKDIVQGPGGSKPANLTVSNKLLFFSAGSQTGANANVELWKTDGTSAGTTMVKEIAAGNASSSPSQLVDVAGQLFFVANDGINGAELWVSNGTAAGTVMVKNLVPGSGSPGIQELRSINGVAVFTADDGINGREIWVSDGTASGTFMIRDLTNDSSSSNPQHIFNFGERLLYSAATYVSGQEPRLGNLVPEIVVTGPSGVLAPNATVNFGDCTTVNIKTIPIAISNDGLNTLKSLKVEITGPHAKEFTLAAKPPTAIGPDAGFTLNVRFAPKALGARTAVLTILSNDPDEPSYVLNLTGTGAAVFIAQPTPVARLVNVGDPAAFTVDVNTAGDNPPQIQWRKVAAPIPGATGEDFEIQQAALSHASTYTVQVKVGTVQTVSDPVALHVVDDTVKTLVVKSLTSASLKVDAKFATTKPSVVPTYEWWRKIGTNPDENLTVRAQTDSRIKGANTATLKIDKPVGHEDPNSLESDSGLYYCKVTAPGATGPETVVGGNTVLTVFTAAPEIAEFNPPDSVVGAVYDYTLLMNTVKNNIAPTGFAVKGLPPGLKMDAKTGRIFGRPTKGGFYKIIITASNAISKVTAEKTIEIKDLPAGTVGTFNCLVERNVELNSNMGGRLDLTVTTTGAFTGSLTLGTTKLAVKGELEASPTNAFNPRAKVILKRPKLPDLTVDLEITPDTIAGGSQVQVGGNIAAITGWRQIWNGTTNTAASYMGYYTLGLALSGGPSTLPQGVGYASFTVAKDGKLSVAGRTSDGEGVTCGTFVGPIGQVLVFQPLYMTTPKGSLLGQMTVGLGANAPTGNSISGALDIVRPKDTRKTPSRVYAAGYGHLGMPVELDVFGGLWTPVVGDIHPVMDLEDGVENVEVVFDQTEEALADASQIPAWITAGAWPSKFGILSKNKIALPTPNVTGLKFSMDVAKATFTGSFTLKDSNPRQIAPLDITRTPTFQGLIVRDGTEVYGVGYYLIPKLPQNGDPNADPPVPATTPTNSDILSGSVVFQKAGGTP
jgi:ELWxxDGT repeat protein